MNERIQKLVEQARANEPVECSVLTKQQWLEKFAELIVLQVLERVEESISDSYDIGDADTAAVMEALAITILDDFDMELPQGAE